MLGQLQEGFLDYLPALISLVGGILAFFFGKSGETNKVGGIGWAMAALLVGGGLLGLYVLHEKRASAAEAASLARLEAEKAAVAAAKQSALVMTLIGDFDLKQKIPLVGLLFEFPYGEDNNPANISEGFTGPFPHLPAGVVGTVNLQIGDAAHSKAEFRSEAPGRILLTETVTGNSYEFTNAGFSEREKAPKRQKAKSEGVTWFAQPEPVPNGFVYGVNVPAGVQLRRLLYSVVAQEPLGFIGFPPGKLGTVELERVAKGLAANPPFLTFFIRETGQGERCDSYVRIPLRFVRSSAPISFGEDKFDGFEMRLTSAGFVPDPCNNNPF